ncbi:hemolysin family protein [Methanocella sp. MCL-LM]|uniref:hemolysin family protein n=1 Tax=Methanocella sp. MCL-LM TaxID=3412035 RepID=UPI003C7423AA
MSNLLIEAVVVVFLIILNGLFAMAEIAIVSSRKARLQQLANEGDKNAGLALELAQAPGDFLSTVQVGITLIGVLNGAFGGATIAEDLAPYISAVPALSPYAEPIAIATVVLAITFLTIVVGELVPKRIGLNSAEKIALIIAGPMRFLSMLAMPAVRLLSLSTELSLRVLRIKPSVEPPVTEEEIKVLIDQGAKAGVFEEAESDMVESVFRLGERRISAMMVPRTDVTALYTDDSLEEVRQKITESGHSIFPVCEGGLDEVLGIVYAKDLLSRYMVGQPLDLKATMKEPLFIPESMPALKALELFKKSGKNMALIIDEYGGLQGLVTIHDIMESVVGDISEIEGPKVVQRDDGSWLVDGMMPVDEFKNELDIDSLPEEESGMFQTLGGFVMTHLHRIPAVGNKFTVDGYTYEVMDMDGMRVDKVLVTPPAAEDE